MLSSWLSIHNNILLFMCSMGLKIAKYWLDLEFEQVKMNAN